MNKKSDRRLSSLKGRMADTPHRATQPRRETREGRKKLKPSIYYGILTYLLRVEFDSFTREQQFWIISYSKKLSDEEILRAGRFTDLLLSVDSIRMFHHRDIWNTRCSIPWIEPYRPPEILRIGKGYSDKGALRPLHQRGRQLSEIKFWDEDLSALTPPNYQAKGEWITADEVKSLMGETIFDLATLSLMRMMHPSAELLSHLQIIQSRLD
jgi:hypothetical protein